MSIKSVVKQGLNIKAILGVIAGIILFNVIKTKIPQIS